tara:strand:+ start:1811 stop:2608 length:798 start_codon:yes stop_codon:yes gene_type:complete
MNTLEESYDQIRLNESIAAPVLMERLGNVANLSGLIQQELTQEYEKYRKRNEGMQTSKKKHEVFFPDQQNDEAFIKDVLGTLQSLQDRYGWALNHFVKTKNKGNLKKALAGLDQSWKSYISGQALSMPFKIQPLNLALFNVIQKMGMTNFPVAINEEGWPVYPKHLIHKFVAMDVLEGMVQNKEIDPKQKEFVDNVLFRDASSDQLKDEVENYFQRTNIQKPVSRAPAPARNPQPEPELGAEPKGHAKSSTENRADLLKRLLKDL